MLNQTLIAARKQKGLTQEELAEQTGITVRTIQRIESGESVPRSYTLKTIAAALDLSFEALGNNAAPFSETPPREDELHFLQMLTLSCFSYLLVPFLHFLLPVYLLGKNQGLTAPSLGYARRLIRGQVYWLIAFNAAMLLTVAWNLFCKKNNIDLPKLHYLTTLFIMYAVNGAILLLNMFRLKRLAATAFAG